MITHAVFYSIANSFSEKITNLDALLIINQNGKIVESRTTEVFDHEFDLDWLKMFAMIVSVRFPISDFHKQLGGLD